MQAVGPSPHRVASPEPAACDLKLFVLNGQEAAVADLVAAPFVRAVNSLASDRIDELLAEPIAGVPIDLTEGDALRCRYRRVDGDRA